MAIRTVVTRGFGNGTFNGTIAFVVVRGYAVGVAIAIGERFGMYRGLGVGSEGVTDKTSVGQEHVSRDSEE